uniref:Uncharacterized protein n=1 Tax=viral metagenome TaxID=1070528 RepID=A0A6M3IEZ4_9ZZZZ
MRKKLRVEVGDLIVRPVRLHSELGWLKKNIYFTHGIKPDQRRFRCQRGFDNGFFTEQLVAKSAKVSPDIDKESSGLICICEGRVPEDWIAFEVSATSKNGGVAFVFPIMGTDEELFAHYDKTVLEKIEKIKSERS